MKVVKFLKEVLVMGIVCLVLYVCFKGLFAILAKSFGYNNTLLRMFVYSLLSALFIYGITYKRLWTLNALKTPLRQVGFYTLMLLVIGGTMLFIRLNGESRAMYHYVMSDTPSRGWRNKVHEVDDTLGYKPVPGVSGFHTFQIGPDIPMRFDSRGFRVPVQEDTLTTPARPVDIMYFGCSCSYGDACPAEETFAYLVSRQTHLNYANAGVCGYGLSQMYLLVKKMVPRYKPKYVVLQYSPWLIERGTKTYAPSYLGLVTNPYFAYNNNRLEMKKPVFRSYVMSVDRETLVKEYRGHYLKWYFGFGLKFAWEQAFADFKSNMHLRFHPEDRPATDRATVERLAYEDMIKTITDNGARAIIWKYGDPGNNKFPRFAGAAYANADSALDAYMASPAAPLHTPDLYKHFRKTGKGNDSMMVDAHPNLLAHTIIAETIISQIK